MVKSKPSLTAQARAKRQGDRVFNDFVERHMNARGQFYISNLSWTVLESKGLNGRTALQHFIDEEGLYGKVTVMDDADFDRYVEENGLTTLYRGMRDGSHNAVDMHANFLYDDKYYVGEGIFGDGMYFSDNEYTGQRYSNNNLKGGAVIKVALKSGARVITSDDAYMALSHNEHKDSINDMAYRDGTVSALAMSNGYDAISVDKGDETYYVVLNRDAVVASSTIRRTNRHGAYIV